MAEGGKPSAQAFVRISASPDGDLHRALNGTVNAARRAQKQIADDSKRTNAQRERETKESYKKEEREHQALVREKIREQERLVRITEQFQKEMTRNATREAQRTAQAQIRESEKASREQKKNAKEVSDYNRRVLFAAGGAAYGAVQGGMALVGRGQALAGVGTLDERLSVAGRFRRQMIITSNEARVSAEERIKIEEMMLQTSEKLGISILDLSGALANAQQKFDQFRATAEVLPDLAKFAVGKGLPITDVVDAIGSISRALDLTSVEDPSKMDPEKQRKALDLIIASSEKGSIESGAVARDIAPLAAPFAMQTGRAGLDGLAELLALAQTLGQSQPGQSGEVATQIEQMLVRFSDADTQKRFKSIGIEVTQGGKIGGTLKNFGEIGRLLNQDFVLPETHRKALEKRVEKARADGVDPAGIDVIVDDFTKKHGTQNAFKASAGIRKEVLGGRLEAMRGVVALMAALNRDEDTFTRLQTLPEGQGLQSAESTLADLEKDPMFNLEKVGAKAQADTVRDADRIVAAITPAVKELTELQTKFPMLTESMGVVNNTMQGLIAALLTQQLFLGGKAIAGANAAGGALGTGMGLLGKAGMVGAAGLAGYLAGDALFEAIGWDREKMGEGLWETFNHSSPNQKKRGFDEEHFKKYGPGAGPSAEFLRKYGGGAERDVKIAPESLMSLKDSNKADVTVRVLGNAEVVDMSSDPGMSIDVDAGALGSSL